MLRRCYAPNTQGDRKRRVVFGGAVVIIENKLKSKLVRKGDSDRFETMSLRSSRSERVLSKKRIGQKLEEKP
jgi:hypothetical protein